MLYLCWYLYWCVCVAVVINMIIIIIVFVAVSVAPWIRSFRVSRLFWCIFLFNFYFGTEFQSICHRRLFYKIFNFKQPQQFTDGHLSMLHTWFSSHTHQIIIINGITIHFHFISFLQHKCYDCPSFWYCLHFTVVFIGFLALYLQILLWATECVVMFLYVFL